MFQKEGDETDTPCLNHLFSTILTYYSEEQRIILEIIFEAVFWKTRQMRTFAEKKINAGCSFSHSRGLRQTGNQFAMA